MEWISVKDRLPEVALNEQSLNVLGATKLATGVKGQFEYCLLKESSCLQQGYN